MANLVAGDLVLTGKDEINRVIVNQHMRSSIVAPMVNIQHATGSLSLTADHVIFADGKFVAARDVKIGSVLEPHSVVTDVTESMSAIINPLTTNSRILAAGLEGQPVLGSTHPEWIAQFFLDMYPMSASLTNAISYLFPAKLQAYYDAVLEPINNRIAGGLKMGKTSVPTLAAAVGVTLYDIALSAGFLTYSLASVEGVVALVATAAAIKASRK